MNYQILARKWRPQSFQEIIGQDNIVTAISNGLSSGRIHHAWLFSGTRGIGKTSIARLLAKSLNCMQGISSVPCRKCTICLSIEKGRCLDFIEIDAASRTKVEDIKEILDNIYYSPTIGRFKIYLIDEVHMLSRHSFNAFLKNLEEPPKHVKFILATTDLDRIPKTILSRCLCFHLHTLSQDNILLFLKNILIKEKIIFDEEALQIISYNAQGSMRDALNLTEQAITLGNGTINQDNIINMLGLPNKEHIFLLTYAILSKSAKKTIILLNKINKKRVIWEKVLIEILNILHNIAIIQLYPEIWEKNIPMQHRKNIQIISKKIKNNDIQLCYQILLRGRKELNFAPNHKIGVEMSVLRAITQMQK